MKTFPILVLLFGVVVLLAVSLAPSDVSASNRNGNRRNNENAHREHEVSTVASIELSTEVSTDNQQSPEHPERTHQRGEHQNGNHHQRGEQGRHNGENEKHHRGKHHGRKYNNRHRRHNGRQNKKDHKGRQGEERFELFKTNCSLFFRPNGFPKRLLTHNRPVLPIHCVSSCEWLHKNYMEFYPDPKNDRPESTDQRQQKEFVSARCVDNAWVCPTTFEGNPETECISKHGCTYPRPPNSYCKEGRWHKACWFSRIPNWTIHIAALISTLVFFVIVSVVFRRCIRTRSTLTTCRHEPLKAKTIETDEETATTSLIQS